MKRVTAAVLMLLALAVAQTYKCDWVVVGIGGGNMAGTSYKSGATLGQNAAGQLIGSNYQAFIGFWQSGLASGVQEQAQSPGPNSFATRLYAPQPNPSRSRVAIRYTLDATHPTLLQVHDLTGRVVRTLCASSLKRGAYSVVWNGTDDRGRNLASGVYFVRLIADNYRSTQKVVLQK